MIKFEIVVPEQELVIGDFKIPPGQRALKISFSDEDVRCAYDETARLFLEGGGQGYAEDAEGVIYIWGTKLAALERMLRESKRRGDSDG